MFIKNLQLTLYLIETAQFSSKIANKTGCPPSPLHSYSAVNESLDNTNGQEKMSVYWKKKKSVSLFSKWYHSLCKKCQRISEKFLKLWLEQSYVSIWSNWNFLNIAYIVAPHSSILAWKIPWMEEPGRLQSMGSLRVGYDWATSLSLFTFLHWRRK